MERKRGELVLSPTCSAPSRNSAPHLGQVQCHFTQFDQVNQLVGAWNRTGQNKINAHAL